LHCPHDGQHDQWGYKVGTGIATLFCRKCGKPVMKEPVDDLPREFFEQLSEMDNGEEENPE